MRHKYLPDRLQVAASRLLPAERAFGAFLEQLACGWRDGDGRTLGGVSGLEDRFEAEAEALVRELNEALEEFRRT